MASDSISDWHNPWGHTASYFVFKSILTIISSFVSISILTIHFIEHNNHKFNDIPSISLTTTRSRSISPTTNSANSAKTFKKFPTSERIIKRLTWLTIIIFCFLCIILSLLTIIEQVAGLNEFEVILCNKWTMRVISSTFQFGVGIMHCLFTARLYSIYNNNNNLQEFAYSTSTIGILILIIMNLSIASSVIVLLYLEVDEFPIYWLGQKHSTCTMQVPRFVNIIIGLTELTVGLLVIYLFAKPMYYIIKIHKSAENDIQYPSKLIFEIYKISILTLVAIISTFLSTAIIGWTYAIWPSFIDMPLNCICVLFMTDYYPNGYKKICCLCTKLRIKLFKNVSKKQLRSPKIIFHAPNQSSVLPLNDITKVEKQKETEEYLGIHDRLQLNNNASYDPFGGKPLNNNDGNYSLLNNSSQSNSQLNKVNENALKKPSNKNNSKHKIANTTEMMIMDINDTMINRTMSNEESKNNKQQLLENNKKINKMKKDSSFALTDGDIDNLMETIDNHPQYLNKNNSANINEPLSLSNQFSTQL